MGYTQEEIQTTLNTLCRGIIDEIKKDQAYSAWFFNNFSIAVDLKEKEVQVSCKYETKVPEQYIPLISTFYEPNYRKVISKPFTVYWYDAKTVNEQIKVMFNSIKKFTETKMAEVKKMDDSVLQYIGLLKLGYHLRIICYECTSIFLYPYEIDDYLKVIEEYYPVKDITQYRKDIIEQFANEAKKYNHPVEYNYPRVEIPVPHRFNEYYEKNVIKIQNNQKYSAIIAEITAAMKESEK